jgi:DNA polymerase-3 subunit epsilon
MFNERIVFLDLETTGGSLAHDRIIEIGLVDVECGKLVDEWSTLVNPQRAIPSGVQVLTGITDEMVSSAPTFEQVASGLAERLQGKILAAHNARFDYGFLKEEFRRAGQRYAASVLCTVKLSRRLFPVQKRHNLDALIVRHAIFCIDRHRALGDARVLWQLAQLWRRDVEESVMADACRHLLRRPVPPPGLTEDLFDQLPEAPGVYTFYGADDIPLYVGRARNIRSHVLSHFGSEAQNGRDASLRTQVQRVRWQETSGELGAYLMQRRLIEQLAPSYGRKLGPARETWSFRWRPASPTEPPELVELDSFDTGGPIDLYGLFRSRRSALQALGSLAQAYGLCRVAIGLEQTSEGQPCSALASGRCRGTCLGAEKPIAHAMRLAQALSRLRLADWPFRGRIGVRERFGQRCEIHVIDQWCYVCTAASEDDLNQPPRGPAVFDANFYQLIVRTVKSPPRGCDVLQMPELNAALDAHAA